MIAAAVLLAGGCDDEASTSDGDDGAAEDVPAFCAAYEAIGASRFATNEDEDPAVLREVVAEAGPLFDDLRTTAPGAVAADAAAVDAAFDRMAAYLEAVGFTTPEAPPPDDVVAAFETLDDSGYAGSPVGTFVEGNCNLDLEDRPTFDSISDTID